MRTLPKNLEGKIKSLKTIDSDNIIEYTEFDKEGKITLVKVTENNEVQLLELFEYDEFGNETLYEKYEPLADFGEGLTITQIRENKYNEQNLLIFECEEFTNSEHDFGTTYYYDYTFNSSGKILKKVTYDLEKKEIGATDYSYFPNGILASEIFTLEEHGLYRKLETYYDETGLLIKHTCFTDDNEEKSITEYELVRTEKEEY
jgi:hypothetical protein